MEEEMLSRVSDITTLHGVEEGCSDSNSSNRPRGSNKRHRQDMSATPSARFKGVVSQPNGRWGAQIYVKKERIWIGTFKSKSEAATAYDSATVHLRSQDSPRNYPLTPQTSLEPDFQNLFERHEILSMLRDGLYQTKFNEFVNSRSLNQGKQPDGLSLSLSTVGSANVWYQQLFQKELAPSDVGKLNRLVIPKRFAEKYFPEVSKEEKHPGVIDDIQLSFFDREMKCWTFRYCYWRSSQSYVFTRGWNRFVKDRKLEAKDMVTFYKCRKEQKEYYMIDVALNGAESNGGFVGTHAAGNREDLQLGFGQISINESGPSDRPTSTLMQNQEDMEVAPPQREEDKKKVVMLFGVNIS
ncbi:AP2/ERF and B3 domain-containing transcription factor At1g50680-like [Papaver somniferum]|uniref:AP2/ERF and B3 domain-containing transcription factor At1g50680-like n=1 Tax=Papaver somniferum TaxID=3469 RepID=UPI000E6FF5A2|nr:AP2/ERF and B3 domain-containing transcription factor At1g50680-like [Papaver somniferum]